MGRNLSYYLSDWEIAYWGIVGVCFAWWFVVRPEIRRAAQADDCGNSAPGWDQTLTTDEMDRLEDGDRVTLRRYHGGKLVLEGEEVHPGDEEVAA